jgi:transposase InsO family protein
MYNDGYAHLLTVIDVFSKYAWAVPLKSKSAENVIDAFRVILSERNPLKIQSDKGTEFSNEKFKRFLADRGIKYFTTNNPDVKAAVVERFNRTLKGRMYKYFTKFNTLNYVSVLPKLLRGYNNRLHSSTGVPPSEVSERNAFIIARHLSAMQQKNPSLPLEISFEYRRKDYLSPKDTRKIFPEKYLKFGK